MEFPGGPVVRTPSFHCCGPGSVPGQGTKILKATWCGQKKNYAQTSEKNKLDSVTKMKKKVDHLCIFESNILQLKMFLRILDCCHFISWRLSTFTATSVRLRKGRINLTFKNNSGCSSMVTFES